MPKKLIADEMNKCIGCLSCMLICSMIRHQDHSIKKSSIKIRTSGGLSGRFISIVCQACKKPPCADVCLTHALSESEGGGVILDKEKCNGCRRCETACLIHAIGYDEDEKKPIICHHCGVCSKYCPHGCLFTIDVEK